MSGRVLAVAGLSIAALSLAACATESNNTATSSTPAPATSGTTSGAASPTTDPCAVDSLSTLTPGTLTVGTDSPAYEPYFVDDDPTNGKGFESAFTYALAEQMGFAAADVSWVVVPFDKSFAPGRKNFDIDVNQVSIKPKRAEAVDFSQGYYQVNQAVVALADNPAAEVTSIAELKKLKLGAQVATTSLTYVTDVVQPDQEAQVYNNTNDAKSALNNGTIDAIVVDLPTAFYITAVEIENSVIVGQFEPQDGVGEEFGVVLAKGSPLTPCVDLAIDAMKESGELDAITQEWLSEVVDAPVFTS